MPERKDDKDFVSAEDIGERKRQREVEEPARNTSLLEREIGLVEMMGSVLGFCGGFGEWKERERSVDMAMAMREWRWDGMHTLLLMVVCR